jgi:hypothetical protein
MTRFGVQSNQTIKDTEQFHHESAENQNAVSLMASNKGTV